MSSLLKIIAGLCIINSCWALNCFMCQDEVLKDSAGRKVLGLCRSEKAPAKLEECPANSRSCSKVNVKMTQVTLDLLEDGIDLKWKVPFEFQPFLDFYQRHLMGRTDNVTARGCSSEEHYDDKQCMDITVENLFWTKKCLCHRNECNGGYSTVPYIGIVLIAFITLQIYHKANF